MAEKELGKVIHYFDKAMVAVIKLTGGGLKLNESVKFVKGEIEHTDTINSMQIEHEDIKSAKKGQEVAVKVSSPVKEGSIVYKAE
ncbi:hypothetical protein IIA95_01575 [Patescibacteria group bacterium]|nr:hypothetical protein [Patescibacteria group bacterium]